MDEGRGCVTQMEDIAAKAIEKAFQTLRVNLGKATKVDKDAFVARPGFYLGGAPFKIYQDLLNECSVQSFQELEGLVKNGSESAREALEELWSAEDDWNDFLRSVSPQDGHQGIGQGDVLDSQARDIQLVSINGGQTTLGRVIGGSDERAMTHFVLLRHLA